MRVLAKWKSLHGKLHMIYSKLNLELFRAIKCQHIRSKRKSFASPPVHCHVMLCVVKKYTHGVVSTVYIAPGTTWFSTIWWDRSLTQGYLKLIFWSCMGALGCIIGQHFAMDAAIFSDH